MKVTNEEFLQRLSVKNPVIEPLEEYQGSNINILCRCKVCSHEWSVRPGNLFSGKGCPSCAHKRTTKQRTKTQEAFLVELSEKNPTVEVMEEYHNSLTKILFRCKKCHYEWPARPSDILKGKGCPVCATKQRAVNQTKTHDAFLAELSKNNRTVILLEEYQNAKTKILFRCKKCNHEWPARPSDILNGKGCPVCGGSMRKDNETFLLQLAENNPTVEVLEEYRTTNSKILFRCRKCHHEWSAKPGHILEGHGCPVCGGSMRKDNDAFLAQLAKINSMIEPLEPYVNARKKIQCRCNYCKNEWPSTPDKLLQGNGCPNCDKRNKTSFPEQSIFYYLQKVYPDTINRYYLPNSRTELDIFVPSLNIGIEYDGVYWHESKAVHEAQKYQKCKEHGTTLYRIRESKQIIEGIADIIIVRHKPYNFETLDSALKELFSLMNVQISVNTFIDSVRIREQFYTELINNSLATLYPDVAAEWHAEKNGTLTPKMVSYGSNEKLWWKCSVCQHEWQTAVAGRTTGGRGCPICAKGKLSHMFKKKNEDFVEQLKNANPNLEPLEEYKTAHEKILIRCKVCGNEWNAAPANILNGKDCPQCSRKRGAAKIASIKQEYWKQEKANISK